MPDQPDTSPPPERAPGPAPEPSGKPAPGSSGSPKPKHRRRAIVWPLIVLASVVLIFSIIANWVQTEALDTNQVKNTTDQIVTDPDVQQALATYTVDQLYANVDVQGQIAEEAAERRPAAGPPGFGGDQATRHQRGRAGARLASGSEPGLDGDRRGPAAVRQPDREQGHVRLDHRRQRHPRVRERRRRPRHPPRGGPGDDLQAPGPRPELHAGPPAAA